MTKETAINLLRHCYVITTSATPRALVTHEWTVNVHIQNSRFEIRGIFQQQPRVGKRKPAQNSRHRMERTETRNRMDIFIRFRFVQDKTLWGDFKNFENVHFFSTTYLIWKASDALKQFSLLAYDEHNYIASVPLIGSFSILCMPWSSQTHERSQEWVI